MAASVQNTAVVHPMCSSNSENIRRRTSASITSSPPDAATDATVISALSSSVQTNHVHSAHPDINGFCGGKTTAGAGPCLAAAIATAPCQKAATMHDSTCEDDVGDEKQPDTEHEKLDSVPDTAGVSAVAGGKDAVPRNITLIGGISFIVGSIIGSGIFVSPRGIAQGSGSVGFTIVSWAICGIISMLGAFCYAELGTIVKESGADYSYIHFAYGSMFSFIYSWIGNLLIKPASLATITLTCAQYSVALFFMDGCGDAPELQKKLLATVIVLLLAAVNIFSARLAARIQIIFTVAKLVALAIVIAGGLVKLCQGNTKYLSTGFQGTQLNPGKIAVGLYSGMWAYDGWNTANFITEEIINPERNLPLSIMIGLPLVMIIYILTNISYFTVMSIDEIITSPAVGNTWAERVMPGFVWLIPLFVVLSTFGAGNGSLFSSGRLMFVAARNDHLPEVLSMVHCRKYTPVPAICFTAIISIVFLVALDINSLIDFLGFVSWIFYGMNMLAVIIFRFKSNFKNRPRPFRNPLIVPILALAGSIFLVVVPIVAEPRIEFLYTIVFIAVGIAVWVPLVYFKLTFNCTKSVTKFLQLYLQIIRPKYDIS